MKIINILILLIVSLQLFAVSEDSKFWSRVNDYDYNGFYAEYIELSSETDLDKINRGKYAYALYLTGENDSQWIVEATSNLVESLDQVSMSNKERAEFLYILAESSKSLITDASSYMKYSPIYEEAIVECIEIDPSNPYYQLSSAQGLMWFPSSRGTSEDGEALLFRLKEEFPNNAKILIATSFYDLNRGNVNEAEAGFKAVLVINKKNKVALSQLNEINMGKKNLEIRDITIVNPVKTSKTRILKKIEKFNGQIYGVNTKNDIGNKVAEISSVSGAEIKGIQIDEWYIDLELEVGEDNTKALLFVAGGGFGFDYNKDIIPGGLAAIGYMDSNFLGTGNNLLFLTAGIYNKLDLTCPGLVDDGIIDMKISLESMAYVPSESEVIVDGVEAYSVKETFHSAEIGFGRALDIGLSAFLNYKSTWTFKDSIKGHTSPDMIHTNTISGILSFDTVGMQLSALQNANGFKIMLNPSWIYKDNYEAWGKNSSLFKHNNKPSITFRTELGYYSDIFSNQNLSIDLKWLASINPYESDKFKLGQAQSSMDSDSLAGYLPGEIVFEDGLINNLKYTFNIVPSKFNIYAKYDLLFDINSHDFYNGLAIGSSVKLPFDIELSGEFGVGLDANRNSGPGIQASISLSKISIL